MEKLFDALISNAAANVAVLVLLCMVGILLRLLQQQRADHMASADKLSVALGALAEALQQMRLDFAAKGIRK